MESIGDVLYCSDWYKLSISEQKYCIRIIEFSQISRKITGYGLIDCNFEMYMKVRFFIIHRKKYLPRVFP